MSTQGSPMFDSPVVGYALHRVLRDASGLPCDYEFVDANPTFERILGIGKSDLVGRSARQVLADERHADFDWIGRCSRVVSEGGEQEFDLFRQSSGRWYRVHVHSTEPPFFTVLLVDVTGYRRQAEDLEGFFTVNLDLLCIANLEGHFLKVNEAWSRTLGYSSEELCRRQFLEFVHPDDVAPTLEALGKLGGSEDVLDFTNRYRCLDGTYRFIQWRSHPHGDLIYAAARDITEQKRSEEALRESDTNFRALFDSMEDMLVVGTPEGRVLHANESMIAKLGYSLEELDAMGILGVHPPHLRQEAEAIFAAMFRGERDTCPLPLRRKDGTLLPVETRVSFGRWSGQNCVFGVMKDLSKEQEALQKFDKMFELNPSMMALTLLPERRFVDVNQAFVTSLGYTREQLIGRTSQELGLFANPGAMRRSSEIVQREGRIRDFETTIRTADGSFRTGLFSGEVVELQGRQYFLTVMVDITERRKAEETSRQQALYLRTIIENQPGLIWLKDANGRFLAVNTAFARSCGRDSPTDVAGLDDRDVWPKELAEKYRADDAEVMSTGVSKTVEEPIADKDGERWFETFKSPIRDDKGRVIGTTGYARDITERKLAEERLRQSELELRESLSQVEQFRTLVESSGDCFYMVDMDDECRMVYVNEASVRHYAAPREQILTWHIPDWDPDFTYDDLPGLGMAIEKAQRLHLNSKHRIADGSIVPVEITVNYLKASDGRRLAYGWFSNISARLAAEEELRNAKLQAEAASKAKSEFLANMSHEIRTPLNGVIGFTDLLRRTPLSPIQQQYVDNANVSGHTLLEIISDILDFSKIEAGMMALEIVRTDMVELLENSVDIVRFSADRKKLEVLLDIDRSMPRFAMVDPIRLKQILANLLGNAVKFTEKGEVELKVVHEALEEGRGRLRISVRDTGIGISESQQEKLFKAFSQADSSTTRKFGGTGLGLVISDMLAQKMGSRIRLESSPGRGSTFSLDLVVETESGDRRDPSSLHGIARCLVVDDNDGSRAIIERSILSWGIAVESCDNGFAALKLLETQPSFDAIVCDQDMPYLDGLDTIRLIRQKLNIPPERLPVVLLHSSSEHAEMHRQCDEMGVCFRLSKPVKTEELFDCLCRLRETSKARAASAKEPAADLQGKVDGPRTFVILLVEDVEMNILLLRGVLEALYPAAKLLEATNGLDAVETCRKERPDLVLMDVQMPGMDGLEATRRIRSLEAESGHRVPIVALTAGAFKEEQERCMDSGMDAFLTKPIDPDKLKRVIDDFHGNGTSLEPSEA